MSAIFCLFVNTLQFNGVLLKHQRGYCLLFNSYKTVQKFSHRPYKNTHEVKNIILLMIKKNPDKYHANREKNTYNIFFVFIVGKFYQWVFF